MRYSVYIYVSMYLCICDFLCVHLLWSSLSILKILLRMCVSKFEDYNMCLYLWLYIRDLTKAPYIEEINKLDWQIIVNSNHILLALCGTKLDILCIYATPALQWGSGTKTIYRWFKFRIFLLLDRLLYPRVKNSINYLPIVRRDGFVFYPWALARSKTQIRVIQDSNLASQIHFLWW